MRRSERARPPAHTRRTAGLVTQLNFQDDTRVLMPSILPTRRRVHHPKTDDRQTRISMAPTREFRSSVSLPALTMSEALALHAKRDEPPASSVNHPAERQPEPKRSRLELIDVQSEELLARRHMIQIQRQLHRQATVLAKQSVQVKRQAVVSAMQADIDEASGKRIARTLDDVQPATPRSMQRLSKQFNEAMADAYAGHSGISGDTLLWYKLFKDCDGNGSGRVDYSELRTMIRSHKGLNLSPYLLPEYMMQALWKAIDEDNSGYISAGEFGKFMRMGTEHSLKHRKPELSRPKRRAGSRLTALEELNKVDGFDFEPVRRAKLEQCRDNARRFKDEAAKLERALRELHGTPQSEAAAPSSRHHVVGLGQLTQGGAQRTRIAIQLDATKGIQQPVQRRDDDSDSDA